MNKIIISGHLTKNPELHYTVTQKAVVTFTLAVDRLFVNAQGVRETDFIPIVFWGNTAELVNSNCTKGQRLLVEGRLQIRNYDDKNGEKRWFSEVVGDRIEFLEHKATSIKESSNDNEEIPF